MAEAKINPSGTDRLTLRRLTANDAEAFMSWASDPLVTKSLFWDAYESIGSAIEFLNNVIEPHPWAQAICLDGIPIGAITLDVAGHGTARGRCRAEVGYVLARAHWGKGYATHALKLALDRGFRDLNIARIEAFCDPENVGSVRVLERSGMVREGLLKNYVIHRGIVRDRLIFAKTPSPSAG